MWRRPKYLLRQLVLLVAAIAVPLVLLQWYQLRQSQGVARAAAYQSVENYSAGIAQNADQLLADTVQYLEFLSRRPLILALDQAHCDPLLEGVTKRRRHVANVVTISATGVPACFSVTALGEALALANVDAWHAGALASDAMNISRPFWAPVANRMVVAVSVPLRDISGARRGTVSALVDLESLQEEWSRYALPSGSRMLIFDDKGTVISARPDFRAMVGRDVSATVKRARELNPGDVGVAPGVDGVERAFARKSIQKSNWTAVAAIPTEAVFGPAERHFEQGLAMTALVVCAVLLMATLMARRIASSLGTLVHAARSIHGGSSGARAPDHLLGEIGEVAREFNAMLDSNARQMDFYRALSRTNGAIVRSTSAPALFKEICQICVEHGHASIAYVSTVDGNQLTHVAWAGPADDFVRNLHVDIADRTVRGSGLSGLAAFTGELQISNDVYQDPRTLPWRAFGEAIGTRSIAACPFRRGGAVAGTLTLHMTSPGFFTGQVVALLDEIAEDVSFALDNFEKAASLELQDRQLAGLVDTAMDAIISIDVDYKIQLFNRAAAEMFKVSAEKVLGTSLEPFVPRRFLTAHAAHLAQSSETGNTARRTGIHALTALRSDGEEFPIEASISKLGVGGATLMTVVIRDATAMRAAQEAKVAQVAAESASRAKTDFLSRMSHELRTPLNAVLGFSQLLQSDTKDPLSAGQHAHVERIRLAGWHLLALINDVLDVSKIEAGQVVFEEQEIDLLASIEEAVRMTQSAADDSRVTIIPSYRSARPVTVWGDARRLRQILINLLSNAIKYNQIQGSVEINVTADAQQTCIDVNDSGIGMDSDQLAHLFEPFNRLGREKYNIEGTGLGLSLARQLVHLMRGEIAVLSAVGEGTRVRVTLRTSQLNAAPAAAQRESVAPDRAEADESPNGVVLYIEDNPVNFMLVEHLLRRWPRVTLLNAETGQNGLAIARVAPVDLILLDMRLPDMTGVEVLRRLREENSTRALRVVALSASAMPDEVSAAIAAGAIGYWTKPLDVEQFLKDARQLLEAGKESKSIPSAHGGRLP